MILRSRLTPDHQHTQQCRKNVPFPPFFLLKAQCLMEIEHVSSRHWQSTLKRFAMCMTLWMSACVYTWLCCSLDRQRIILGRSPQMKLEYTLRPPHVPPERDLAGLASWAIHGMNHSVFLCFSLAHCRGGECPEVIPATVPTTRHTRDTPDKPTNVYFRTSVNPGPFTRDVDMCSAVTTGSLTAKWHDYMVL